MRWKVQQKKYIFSGKFVRIRRDSCKAKGRNIIFDVVEIPDWTAIIAFTKDRKIILSKQYRYPLKKELIELPGGFVNKGESLAEAAEREFQEETGWKLIEAKKLGTWATMSGKGTNKVTVFIGKSGRKSKRALEHSEKGMKILYKAPKQVLQMIKKGTICSAPYIAAILVAKEKYPELFK